MSASGKSSNRLYDERRRKAAAERHRKVVMSRMGDQAVKHWQCFECGVQCVTTSWEAIAVVCTCPSLNLPASRITQMADVTNRDPDQWFIRAVPEDMASLL